MKTWIGISALAGTIVITIGYTVGTYNSMVGMRTDVHNQWSNIMTEYQRRVDLLINLASVVKSYKAFESKTLNDIIQMRSGGGLKETTTAAPTTQKMLASIDKLGLAINAVFEAYPNLKANEQHNMLMEENRIIEDRINDARTNYNDIVRDYNVFVNEFPARIIASTFNFVEEKFWTLETPTATKAPTLDL